MVTLAGAPDRRAVVLTTGERAEVVSLLTRLVADPDRFNNYLLALRAARKEAGPEVELRLLTSGTDVPWEQIAAGGFTGQSDEVLADLATSPEALEAFLECHMTDDGEMGPWYYDAILRDSPVVEAAVVPPVTFPSEAVTTPPPPRPPRGGRFLRWAVPAGLAAGLLLGGLAGWLVQRDGNRPAVVVARATIERPIPRGPGDKPRPSVVVNSPVGGFVTVVALYATLKQQVTEPSNDFDPIPAGGSKTVLLDDDDAVAVVFVVTETPAGEVIRRRLANDGPRIYTASEAEQFSREVETLLKETGFKRYAIGREAIPTSR